MTGQAAEGGRARSREGHHRARPARFGGDGAKVVGHPLDVALARHHHEERRLRGEQGHEQPRRPQGATELEAPFGEPRLIKPNRG